MKIQYCSDLHLEFRENKYFLSQHPLVPAGEILLLAGDIVLLKDIKLHDDFFNYIADNFQVCYWLPGNHEYYSYDINNVQAPLYEKIRANFFLVNNKMLIYKNTEIIFTTLWSKISAVNEWNVEQSVSDFSAIKNNGKKFTAHDFNQLHKNDIAFLEAALAKPTPAKRIIVTHHVPTLLHYPQQYKHSNINEAFATELHDFIFDCNADYWIYGHHHVNTAAFKIGNTTMLTNQLGYVQYNEHVHFKTDAIIEID